MQAIMMKDPCALVMLLVGCVSWATSSVVATATLDSESGSCFDGSNPFFVAEDWDYCHPIRPDLFLYYKPLLEEGNLKLGLHATHDTFGWSSLALAGNGGMKGASQIVVRRDIDNDNMWVAEDRNSQDFTTPTLDDSQDVQLLFANQTSDTGETAWGVVLPMNSCDERDYPILNITSFMLWALGDDHDFGFHGTRRGQFNVNLLQRPILQEDVLLAVDRVMDDSSSLIDILMPNVSVSLGEGGADPSNPYVCSVFDLEQMRPEDFSESDAKVHVTRVSPVIDEDAQAYVHHMLLFSCSNSNYEHLQVIQNCQSMPSGCTEMKTAWAVGGGDLSLPDDVGLPFGENGQRRLLLQTHYYNPSLHENIYDSSGFRAYFTQDLRPQEAGIMQINGGTGDFMRSPIPAGQSSYDLDPFIFPSRCTEANWAEPINVLGVAHHMHMMGTKMTIDIERKGQALGSLRNEMHYDFNHQSMVESPIKQILPGDQIVMNCRYDTSGQEQDVSFGDYTQQEMCYSVMLYYPKQRQENIGYLPMDVIGFNSTKCFTPATGVYAQFDLSECTQSFFESVPSFLNMNITSLGVTEAFGGLEMCNSAFYETAIMPTYPGLCPDCYKSQNCTETDIGIYAQTALCPYYCTRLAGVSVYPDVSDTVEFTQGVFGCDTEDSTNGVIFFVPDEPKQQPACQRLGFASAAEDGSSTSGTENASASVNELVEDEDSVTVSNTVELDSSRGPTTSGGLPLVTSIWTALLVLGFSAALSVIAA